jgi:hypothetical protein
MELTLSFRQHASNSLICTRENGREKKVRRNNNAEDFDKGTRELHGNRETYKKLSRWKKKNDFLRFTNQQFLLLLFESYLDTALTRRQPTGRKRRETEGLALGSREKKIGTGK